MNKRVAVLIDAENLPANHADRIFSEMSKHGATATRRAYGDFVQRHGVSWLSAAALHAIDTVQVCSPAKGKNCSDIRLTIDAIELLAQDRADIFCICSSDGDFTPLAKHLRGAGKFVVGIGSNQASASFRQSCNVFVAIDQEKVIGAASVTKPVAKNVIKQPKSLLVLVKAAIESVAGGDGWIAVGLLGNALRRADPQFSRKVYGSGTLSTILRKEPALELQQRNGTLHVRLRAGITVLSA